MIPPSRSHSGFFSWIMLTLRDHGDWPLLNRVEPPSLPVLYSPAHNYKQFKVSFLLHKRKNWCSKCSVSSLSRSLLYVSPESLKVTWTALGTYCAVKKNPHTWTDIFPIWIPPLLLRHDSTYSPQERLFPFSPSSFQGLLYQNDPPAAEI